jgi:peptide deformylase
MAVKPIITVPHPTLRKKTRRIPAVDKSIQKLAADMIETLDDADGVGLAAPQVGVSLRMCVIHMPEEEPFALVNPEVVKRIGQREVMEACLSIPGYQAKIKRSEAVTVKALDLEGKPMRLKATALLAQALEHEIDHLDGVLYTDYVESQDRLFKIEPEDCAPDRDAVDDL